MAKDTAQLANNQEVLFTVGPFGGLDLTNPPYYVAPGNAAAMSNLVTNRSYGAISSVEGRTANVINATGWTAGGLAANAQALKIIEVSGGTGQPTILSAVSNPTNFAIQTATIGGAAPATLALPAGLSGFVAPNISGRIVAAIVPNNTYYFFDLVSQGTTLTVPDGRWFSGIPVYVNRALNTVFNWGIVAPVVPTVAAGAAGNLSGIYYYAITFSNGTGSPGQAESGITTFAGPVTVAGNSIDLTVIPTSADAQVTTVNIYRIGGTIGGIPLLVGQVNNGTAAFNDNLADVNVVGRQLVLRADPVTTISAIGGGFPAIEWHKGRMWGLNRVLTTGNDNFLYYSGYNLPMQFNTVSQSVSISPSQPNDFPVALRAATSLLYIFYSKSLHVMYGDDPQSFVVRKVGDIGCSSKGSVAAGYGAMFWLSNQGVYMVQEGGQPINISDITSAGCNLRAFLENRKTINTSTDPQPHGFVHNRAYYLSFPGQFNITFVFDIVRSTWTQLNRSSRAFDSRLELSTLDAFNNTTNLSVIADSTATTGFVEQWFTGETDNGAATASSWTSGISDSGVPHMQKQYRYLVVDAPNQANTLSVTITINPTGSAPVALPAISINLASGPTRHEVGLPPKATGADIQVSFTASTTVQLLVNKIEVLGYVKRQNVQVP